MYSNERVVASDDSFLETLAALAHPAINETVKPKESDASAMKLCKETRSMLLTKEECERLYVEVLYTIKHKVGTTCDGHSSAQEELYHYAREAFQMTDAEHMRLLAVASEEKPPIVILHVNVVEARNLEPKDADGFSDPYCMLGITPGSRLSEIAVSEPFDKSTEKRSKGQKASVFRKFSATMRGSFKRKDYKNDVIPAKYIQTTSVQPNTLNPVWNEKFRFDLESVSSDVLHLDVWDHDDEVSVFDVARQLNEVQSLKGLGRIFKEIAQSARSHGSANIDDFLGCLDVSLKDVPSAGLDLWYPLRARSVRSNVRGDVHLKLSLATREDRGVAEDDTWTEVKQHEGLISIFAAGEIRKCLGSCCMATAATGLTLATAWEGKLPKEASTILHQHAIQGDVTECQSAACHWIACSRHFPALSAQRLLDILEWLEKSWSPGSLARVEEDLLGTSFTEFTKRFVMCMTDVRQLFPADDRGARALHLWLRCMAKMQELKLYKRCCPFSKDVHCEVTVAVKSSTQAWYEAVRNDLLTKDQTEDESRLRALSRLCSIVLNDCQEALVSYTPSFLENFGFDYFSIVYKIYEFHLAGEVRHCLGNMVERAEKFPLSPCVKTSLSLDATNMVTENKLSAHQITPLAAAFELYFRLQQLLRMTVHYSGEKEKLLLPSFQSWFSPLILEWTHLVRQSVTSRITVAIAEDKLSTIPQQVSCSQSALDLRHCYRQIIYFWQRLEWQDADESFAFTLKLLDILCHMTTSYAKGLHSKLKKDAYCDDEGQFNVNDKLCAALNDLTFVRSLLTDMPSDLRISNVTVTLCSAQPAHAYNHDDSRLSAILSSLVDTAESYISSTVDAIVSKVCERMRPDIKKNMLHFCWSADAVPIRQACQPLTEYLMSNLAVLRKLLISASSLKLLSLHVWTEVLKEFSMCTKGDAEENPAFFARLHDALLVVLDFLHDGDNNVELSDLKTDLFQKLQHLLWTQRKSTEELISIYYRGLADMQKQAACHCCLGTVGVRAMYSVAEQLLLVEVVDCKNLIPLDANGFSDPYVTVELCPKFLFPSQPAKETSIKKKTLNPLFEDVFEFRIPLNACQENGAMARFAIMDYDFLSENDFGGEAFLALAGIPEATGMDVSKNLVQLKVTELAVLKPEDPQGTDVFHALTSRHRDRLAQEFLHQRKLIAEKAEESLSTKQGSLS